MCQTSLRGCCLREEGVLLGECRAQGSPKRRLLLVGTAATKKDSIRTAAVGLTLYGREMPLGENAKIKNNWRGAKQETHCFGTGRKGSEQRFMLYVEGVAPSQQCRCTLKIRFLRFADPQFTFEIFLCFHKCHQKNAKKKRKKKGTLNK
jgi:hypothetical protein